MSTTTKGILLIALLGPILAFIGLATPPSELERLENPVAAKAKEEQQKKAAQDIVKIIHNVWWAL